MTEIATPAGLNDRSFIIAWNRKLRLRQVSILVDWGNKWWYKYPDSCDASPLCYLAVSFIHMLFLSSPRHQRQSKQAKMRKRCLEEETKSRAHSRLWLIGQFSVLWHWPEQCCLWDSGINAVSSSVPFRLALEWRVPDSNILLLCRRKRNWVSENQGLPHTRYWPCHFAEKETEAERKMTS